MNKQALSLAVLVAGVYPATSNALSLGDIESNSNLNQPLRAKIELLSASAQEARQLQVRLAPNSVFSRVGVDRPAFLNSLRFTSTVQSGKPVILITSDVPMSEPFVNFLVEVSWPQGQLLKEYTVMLDPPVLMQPGNALASNEASVRAEPRPSGGIVNRPAPTSAASPTQVAQAQAQQRARQQQANQQRIQQQQQQQANQRQAQQQANQRQAQQQASQQQARQSAPRTSSRTYRVRKGDTLFKVATRLQQPGVNVDQMMIALYRANPNAFINGNINGLKSNSVLRAPTAQAAKGASRAQARRQVRQQYADWRKFRSTLAKKTVPQKSVASKSTKPAKTTSAKAATTKKPVTTATGKARLEVLGKADKAAKGASAAGSERLKELEKQLALARESLVSGQRKNKDLESRLAALQSTLRKKNRLIALRDDNLAQMQKQLAENGIKPTTVAGAALAGAAAAKLSQLNNNANNGENNTPNQNVIPRTPGETRPLNGDARDQAAKDVQVQQNKIVRTPPVQNNQQEVAKINRAVDQNDDKLVDTIKTDSDSPFADDQSGDNDLMSMLTSPMALKIGAGALFSLLLLWLLSRLLGRRKPTPKKMPVVAEDPVIFDTERDSLTRTHEGEDQPFRELEAELDKADKRADIDDDPFGVDQLDDKDGFNSATSDIVEAKADQDEDEVLMEANVYIAYGLHQQAESELKKALEKYPDRLEYRHKLLENYFASNNRDEFDHHAKAFLATNGADRNSKMWDEIADWGKKISPDNALYDDKGPGLGAAVAAAGAAAAAGVASTIALSSDDSKSEVVAPTTFEREIDLATHSDKADVGRVLDDLQDDDDLGLDDFDFDLDELETELGTDDLSGLDLDLEQKVDKSLDSGVDRLSSASQEVANTINDDFDFSLDDLAGELQQDDPLIKDDFSLDLKEAVTPDVPDVLGGDMDFDQLLNGNSNPVETVAPERTPEKDDDGIGLLGGLAAGAVAAAGATAAAVISGKDKVAEKLDDAGDAIGETLSDAGKSVDNAMDFDLDLPELPDTHLSEVPGKVVDSVDGALDFDLDLPDLPDTSNVVTPAVPQETLAEIEALDFDLDNVNPVPAKDLVTNLQEDVAGATDAANEAANNVTNLNLHLDKESGLNKILPQDTFYTVGDASNAQAVAGEGDESWSGDIDDALSFLDMPDEEIDLHEAHISTKLDLARAYLDMGDIEGARSTLEEVMVEGNDNQRREAETLLHETG